jgi:hypothetical protein
MWQIKLKCWWGHEDIVFAVLLVWIQNAIATPETNVAVSYKAKHIFPYNPSVKPLGIYPREIKTNDHIENCITVLRSFICESKKSFNW